MSPFRRVGLALVVITGACVTDLSVGPRVVATLSISPNAPALVVGEDVQLLAIARDSNGVPFVGLATVWSTSSAAVVTVGPFGMVTGMSVGSATITATTGGQSATALVTVSPAPVIGLSRTTVPFSGTPGAPDPGPQTVTVTNTAGGSLNDLALGTVVYGAGATGWLAASLDQASAPATLTLTAATGTLALGSYSATVPVSSATASNSPQNVTVTFTVTASPPTTLELNAGDGQSASVNTAVAVPPSVIARDAFGNPAAGVAVTFAVTSGGGSLTGTNPATTNAAGVAQIGWTLGNTLGANSLTASATGLTGSPVTFNATATAGPPTQIALSAGDLQSATVNTAVAVAPAVLVSDAQGNPVAGVTVTFAVASGGGNVTGPSQLTNASGLAQVGSWVLGQTADANSLTATSGTLTGSPVTFTATGTPGPATQFTKCGGDNRTAVVGTAITVDPCVAIQDAFNNVIAGVSVTFAIAGGGGSLTGANPVATDAAGQARIGWTLGTTTGANSLTADAAGLTTLTFAATGLPGPATQIVKTAGDGQTATVDFPVPIPPQVQARDQFGNGVHNVPFLFGIISGGGNVQFSGPLLTDSAGFAEFLWVLGTTSGANSFTVSATGLAGSPLTFTATAIPDVASAIAANAGNGQTATVNTAVTVPPQVLVTDSLGNPVSGVAVTFAVASGGGNISGGSQTTNASGLAQVGGWALGQIAGANTLTATSPGLTGSPVTFSATGTAGVATQIALSAGNAQSATVNTAVATPPRVVVRDAFNNPVTGVSVTFAVTGGGGSITGINPASTNGSGFAQVGWVLGQTAGANTMTATAAGLAGSPVSFTATGTAGVATQLVKTAGDNQSAPVSAPLPVAPQVQARDQFGNGVANVSVTFAVTSGGGALTGTNPVNTDASGFAQIGWTLGAAAGSQTISATAAGLAGSPATFTASGTTTPATQIALSQGDGQTATVNTAVATAPRVLVRDASSNPVQGVAVTFAVTAGGGAVIGTNPAITDVNGLAQVGWTLGTGAGTNNNTLTATVTGLAGSPVTLTASATAGTATLIVLSQGDAQSATVNTTVATAPRVVVRDAFNNPKAGVSVTFAVSAGGGSLTGTNPAITDASGFASIGWTLGTTAGTSNNSLTATATGLTGSPVTFTASATTGVATQIALSQGDGQGAPVNTSVAIPPRVVVRDAFNNPRSGVAVTFAVTAGGGSLTGTNPATTDANGLAQIGWTLGSSSGTNNNTLTATAIGLVGSPVTFTASASAGGATQIALSQGDGQAATVNTAVATAPRVLVRDASNNPVAGVAVTFAVTAGGGSLTGTNPAITDGSGFAQIGWTLGTAAGTNNNTLTATATGLTGSPVLFTASATAGTATQIALSQGDAQSATVNTAVATAPRVLVRDGFNNPKAGVAVTFAVTAGSGSLTGANPATTDVNGFASINWTLGTTAGAGNNTLTATATGLAGNPVTFTATATAGVATQIALNQGNNQTATVGTPVAIAPRVLVRDAFNNPKAGAAVTFAVTAGGGSLTGTNPVTTDVNGFAQIAWTLGPTAGTNSHTLTATSAGLTGSPVTFTASGTPGTATQIAKIAGDNQSAEVNAAVPVPPRVQVQDAFGNGVSGQTVTFAVTGGGGSLTGTNPATTDASGFAQIGWTLGAIVGANTLSATANGVAGTPAVTFSATSFAAGATTMLLIAGNNQTDTVSATLAIQYQVRVTDGTNGVSGIPVSWAVTGGGGSINPPTSFTDGSGFASATRILSTTAGAHTATASAGALTGSPATFTATATHGAATQIAVSAGNNQSATVGTTVATPPAVVVRDQFGNAVPSIDVTFTVTGGAGTIVPTSPATIATGVTGVAALTSWTLGNTAGTNNNTLTATAAGLSGSPVTFTASATTGAATQIALNQGNNQSTTVNTAVGIAPRVLVRDALNNPVAGVAVTFTVTGGAGSLTGANPATTDGSGFASIGWTLGTAAGTNSNTLTATATGLSGSPVTFTASATAGAATQIALSQGNGQSATANTAVATPPRVVVRDAFSNPVTGVSVTFAVTAGGGSLTGTNPATTDGSGFASIGWTLGTAAGTNNNTLTATATGLSGSPVTFAASATAGPATQIALSQGNNQTATVNAAVATAPRVLVRDAFSNPVTGTSVTFAVTAGGGSLMGTNPTTTDVNGFASVGWTLGATAGTSNNTLTATATGLAGSPVTFTASATAGPATQIALSQGDGQSATVNTAVSTAPRVLVRDASNNPVQGVAVTFGVTAGGGSLTGTNPATTDVNGFAQVGWTLGTSAGVSNQTLTATGTGLAGSPVTFTATATADAPSATQSSVAATSPITASSGASQSSITVTVHDQFNNPVGGASVTWSATGSGNAPVSTTGTTNTSGVFNLGRLSSTVAQSKTVSAIVNGAVSIPQTATVVVNPAAASAAQSTVAAATSSITACASGCVLGVTGSAITVTARDAFGNPILGAAVVLASTGSNNAFAPSASGNADGGGVFLAAFRSTTAQAKTISATIDGVAITQTAAVTVIPDAAATIALNAGDGQAAVVGTNVATAPSVIVRDQFSNPVSNIPVTFAVTGGGGSVNPVTAINTLGSGIAQVTSWTVGTVAGSSNNTLTATSAGLTGSPVTFTASASVGGPSAAQSSVAATSPITASGGASQSVITVTVRDAFNNTIGGANVTWSSDGTGNTLTSSTGTTNGSGVFNAGRLSSTVAQNKTISAIINPGPSQVAITQTATVTVDPDVFSAAQSLVSASPGSIIASSGAVTSTITVTVRDQFNNPLSGRTVDLSATGGGNTVIDPVSTTNASGVATGTLSSTVAQAKTVSATANGSPTTQTAAVTVTHAAAFSVALNGGNAQSATVNTAVAVPPSVIVRDQFSNPVQSTSVTFTITGGGGTLNPVSGSIIGTNSSGIAQVTSWTLGTSAGTNNNTLSAASAGLSGTPILFTASATVGPPSASQSSVSASSPIIACQVSCVGASQRSTITVTVRDPFNNPIGGATVSLSSNGSNNAIVQPVGTTNSSGQITGTLSSQTAQTKTVTALVNGSVTVTQTGTVVVNPDIVTAGNSLVSAATASITACSLSCVAGSTASTITVTARDQFNNTIASQPVTIAASGANNTFVPASGSTSGIGVFTTDFNSTLAQAKTITATINGVVITQTAAVTVNAATATSIAFSAGAGQTVRVGTAVATDPAVTVTDVFGNLASGRNVTFTVTAGGGSTSPASPAVVATNGSGVATLTSWTLGGTAVDAANGTMSNTLNASVSPCNPGTCSVNLNASAIYIWSLDVASLFNASSPYACNNCHDAGIIFNRNPNNIVGVLATTGTLCDATTRVVAGNAAASLLYLKVDSVTTNQCGSKMPFTASFFTANELKRLRAWINNGALNN